MADQERCLECGSDRADRRFGGPFVSALIQLGVALDVPLDAPAEARDDAAEAEMQRLIDRYPGLDDYIVSFRAVTRHPGIGGKPWGDGDSAPSPDVLPDEVLDRAARSMDKANCSPDPCDDWYVLLASAAAPVLVEHGRRQEREARKANQERYTLRLIDLKLGEAEARGAAAERDRIRQEVERMRSQAIDDRDSAIEGDRTVMATNYGGKKLGLDAVLLALAALDKEVDG